MPDWRREIRARLAGPSPARVDEIADELAQHLEDRYAELMAGGVPEPEARLATLRELEASPALLDELRRVERPVSPEPTVLGEPGPGGWLNGLGSDVRFAVRALGKTPGVTAVALLTLSLAIGANAAIFSVVNAALLRPLPFAEPDRLVAFWGSAPEMGIPVLNYPDAFYVYFRTRSRLLDPVTAYASQSTTLTGAGEPARLNAAWVTADFFRLRGRAPQKGRTFLPDEEARDRNSVAVLGEALWQRRFGGDPQVVGKVLTLDGRPVTVVGVMPAGFDFPRRTELWLPLPTDPTSLNCWCFATLGRLREGRTSADAAREIAHLTDEFWRDRKGEPPPRSNEEPKAVVRTVPLARTLVGDTRTPLLVLLGAVVAVLLVACANIANLLVARATVRVREIGVRCCLGASRWHIVRQLLVESVLLTLAGAAVGLTLALFAVRALRGLVVERLPHLHDVGLDARVLAFTIGVAIATVALFGLAPAVRGSRVDLRDAVKEGARAGRGPAEPPPARLVRRRPAPSRWCSSRRRACSCGASRTSPGSISGSARRTFSSPASRCPTTSR